MEQYFILPLQRSYGYFSVQIKVGSNKNERSFTMILIIKASRNLRALNIKLNVLAKDLN